MKDGKDGTEEKKEAKGEKELLHWFIGCELKWPKPT
jgi:hypothetical protein